MIDFERHLKKNGYVIKSIKRAVSVAKWYNEWLQTQKLNAQTADYKDLMDYIGHLQKQGSSKSKVNESLRNIRLYYDYLDIPNIAFGVVVRGQENNALPLLSEEQLDELYDHFQSKSKKGYWRHSDKIIFSLILYQCLDPIDLFRLELDHLDLVKGRLYVPGGIKRKASRRLSLEAHQIIPLHQYIETHRDKRTDKLLSPQCSCFGRLQGQLKELFKQVKAQDREIGIDLIRFDQIRQSRITLWIKLYGLRKAQYMAGFRWVGDVEKYRLQDTEDLSLCIEKYHPLQ